MGPGGWRWSLLAWGLRLVLHRGEERALNRVIFAPIAIALASVYASTLTPGADWGHSFGLGGLFGDTVLGAVLGACAGRRGVRAEGADADLGGRGGRA